MAARSAPRRSGRICRRIPHGFLQAILADLRRAGVVLEPARPVRWLAASPVRRVGEVTVADVIRAVDGPLVSVHGEQPGVGDLQRLGGPRCSTCGSRPRSSLREVCEAVRHPVDLADRRLPSPAGGGPHPRRGRLAAPLILAGARGHRRSAHRGLVHQGQPAASWTQVRNGRAARQSLRISLSSAGVCTNGSKP